MKKLTEKLGSIAANCALAMTKSNVNSSCMYYLHQPKLPVEAKKLRKF